MTAREDRDHGSPERIVVSIWGASGSGKSSLAVRLVEELGPQRCSRVPTDWYLLTGGSVASPNDGYGWDWPRLAADLVGPDGLLVSTPVFDFTMMTRSDTGSAKAFTLRRVMVVDAMLPFPATDLLVRLDVPVTERRRRLAERDIRWQTNVLERWDRLEASGDRVGIAPVDLTLDGSLPLAELSAIVQRALTRRFGDIGRGQRDGDGLDALP